MDNLTDEDISYMAGLFDGEGSVGIYVFNDYPAIVISLAMCDQRELLRLYEYWNIGKIYDLKPGKDHWRWALQWKITKVSDVMKFLKCILPYSRMKEEQIRVGIGFCHLCMTQGSRLSDWDLALRYAYMDRLKKLKFQPE